MRIESVNSLNLWIYFFYLQGLPSGSRFRRINQLQHFRFFFFFWRLVNSKHYIEKLLEIEEIKEANEGTTILRWGIARIT